ncbi:MAG TPA: hypothetical protein VGO96_10485 [Pyrinomonadaceae bacterium]|nr:hypothetical protein [Pyrinomonadaceae bacterium]
MRFVYAFTLTFALLLLLPAENPAQTRTRRTSTPKRATTATRGKRPATGTAALALQDGRQRVGEKIKQISNFVYLYGRFSKDFEAAAGTGGQPDATANALKNRLVGSLQDIREGLDGLELHFRTTPELERFSIKLSGVALDAAKAEQQANANRLDAAGRSLLEVINRLTDVLQDMN